MIECDLSAALLRRPGRFLSRMRSFAAAALRSLPPAASTHAVKEKKKEVGEGEGEEGEPLPLLLLLLPRQH